MEQRISQVEADIAVLKAVMPRVEQKLDAHMHETYQSRQKTNDKLDILIEKVDSNANNSVRIHTLEAEVGKHHDLLEQAKGAQKMAIGMMAIISSAITFALGAAAKFAGFIR